MATREEMDWQSVRCIPKEAERETCRKKLLHVADFICNHENRCFI